MILAFILAIVASFIAKALIEGSKSGNGERKFPEGNLLIVDTETNGLPKSWRASPNDINNWPRVVSVSWYLLSPQGFQLSSKSYIVKPEGFNYEFEATRIHGITQEYATRNGVSLNDILNEFDKDLSDSKYLVAHNLEFDYAVLYSEFKRVEKDTTRLDGIKQICTMKASINYCKLDGPRGYKYPKLEELYKVLFKNPYTATHNSQKDAEVCLACFKELFNLDIIKF